jgi:hypothetical protein
MLFLAFSPSLAGQRMGAILPEGRLHYFCGPSLRRAQRNAKVDALWGRRIESRRIRLNRTDTLTHCAQTLAAIVTHVCNSFYARDCSTQRACLAEGIHRKEK